MFDVVRGRSRGPTRLRAAVLVSLASHAVLLAGALLLSRPAIEGRAVSVHHLFTIRIRAAR